MSSALSRRRGTLTPMAAAGTMPEWDQAEQPRWAHGNLPEYLAYRELLRSVPGSVATKRLPACHQEAAAGIEMSGAAISPRSRSSCPT